MRSSSNGMSMLPAGMDGRSNMGNGGPSNARSPAYRANVPPHATIRTVTPEDQEDLATPMPRLSTGTGPAEAAAGGPILKTRGMAGIGPKSPKSASRSVPVGESAWRQGMVFDDYSVGTPHGPGTALTHDGASTSSASPPSRPLPFRQRTHTMESAVRQMSQSSTDSRRRVGSFSSSPSRSMSDDARHHHQHHQPPSKGPPESVGFPSIIPARASEHGVMEPPRLLGKEKKMTTRRLIKRQSSRPTSPLISPPPSVDSLPLPVPTDDANKVLQLMRNLCGRMRGEIEYQAESGGPWHVGVAYIDEEKGSLLFDSGQSGPFHVTLVTDLRGCRVLPVDYPDEGKYCLEVVVGRPAVELLLRPLLADEMDLWLAALLCWQQLRPMASGGKLGNGKATSPAAPARPELRRHGSSNGPPGGSSSRTASIIKVGKVLLWDKGLATSPRAIVKRPSTRDLRSPAATSWRRVSCILQDNGEFKLLTENDVTVLSVIELAQLSRCAVQQLDRTVLDEEFAIAIFPIYAAASTQLSIFRPVYVALDSRVHFEVWFVLLRSFTVPDVYRLEPGTGDGFVEVTNLDHKEAELPGEVFRIEKTLNLRVTEAKMKPRGPPLELTLPKSGKDDNLIGNYLAEVILDGEVRARTTTKTQTKTPFWREDCEFYDLPPNLPYLSIVLKRVDGNLESLTHQLQASLGLPKTGNLTEVLCGSVDISLEQLDPGKDHEQWFQIADDKNQSIGTMLVKVHHEELVVLRSREYQALSELLHRFPSGLTSQIAEVLPSSLRRLSDIFLNIFQVSGSAGEWLMALVEDEIDGIGNQASMTKKYRFSNRLRSNESRDSAASGGGGGAPFGGTSGSLAAGASGVERGAIVRDMGKSLAGEANLLFRGNSLLTQSLEFHMRRLGKEYLEETLQDKIFEINEINPNCEVDPSKLAPGEDLDQHWTQLLHLTTEVWACISTSAGRLPAELRHILKYVRAVAEDRYGDFLRTVRYTSVSGFLFLRFICPAVLSPKLFNLLRDHPRPRAQRTFTLITKALQALANLTTFGQKEAWMEPMNRFLNSHRQGVKDYIDHVCAIPADRAPGGGGGGSGPAMAAATAASAVLSGGSGGSGGGGGGGPGSAPLPASYSTPITILGRLGPLAREGFPSLPYLIDHARNFAALVRLWADANPVDSGAVQQLVDGDLLIFNEVCAGLQRRADACAARVEVARRRAVEVAAAEVAAAAAAATAAVGPSLASRGGGSIGSATTTMTTTTTATTTTGGGGGDPDHNGPGSSLEQASLLETVNLSYVNPATASWRTEPASTIVTTGSIDTTATLTTTPTALEPIRPPGSAGSAGGGGGGITTSGDENDRRRKTAAMAVAATTTTRGREASTSLPGTPKSATAARNGSSSHGHGSGHGRIGRNILSGIMKISGRGESPEGTGSGGNAGRGNGPRSSSTGSKILPGQQHQQQQQQQQQQSQRRQQ